MPWKEEDISAWILGNLIHFRRKLHPYISVTWRHWRLLKKRVVDQSLFGWVLSYNYSHLEMIRNIFSIYTPLYFLCSIYKQAQFSPYWKTLHSAVCLCPQLFLAHEASCFQNQLTHNMKWFHLLYRKHHQCLCSGDPWIYFQASKEHNYLSIMIYNRSIDILWFLWPWALVHSGDICSYSWFVLIVQFRLLYH